MINRLGMTNKYRASSAKNVGISNIGNTVKNILIIPVVNRHDGDHRIQCKFGAACTNTTADHRKNYSHPKNDHRNDHRIQCKHGAGCTDSSDDHRKKFSHPKA
jgi:hypothetical protein